MATARTWNRALGGILVATVVCAFPILATAQSISGEDKTAATGSTVGVAFSLNSSAAMGVVGTQNDITFAPGVSVGLRVQGTCAVTQSTSCSNDAQCPTLPSPFTGNEPCVNQNAPNCSVNAAGKGGYFGFLPAGCGGATACTGMRALVLSLTDSSQVIANGNLYTCQVSVAGTATLPQTLSVSNVRMANAQGQAVCGATGQTPCGSDGAVISAISGGSCLGDKNPDGSIDATEVVATINCFAQDDLSLNPSADGNNNGSCEANEVVQVIGNFAQDTCNPFQP